jgi:hypothetical protein
MISRLSASEQDLRALPGFVSEVRADLPAQGLPLSLLRDLKDLIPCDFLLCHAYDSILQRYWFGQQIPGEDDDGAEDLNNSDLCRLMWQQYWDCHIFSYPDRSGDLRSIVKVDDFYSVRQWHSTGMYREVFRSRGLENRMQLCLSEPPRARCRARPDRAALISANPALTSPSETGRCSPCCAPISSSPTTMLNAGGAPSPSSPLASGTCCS